MYHESELIYADTIFCNWSHVTSLQQSANIGQLALFMAVSIIKTLVWLVSVLTRSNLSVMY